MYAAAVAVSVAQAGAAVCYCMHKTEVMGAFLSHVKTEVVEPQCRCCAWQGNRQCMASTDRMNEATRKHNTTDQLNMHQLQLILPQTSYSNPVSRKQQACTLVRSWHASRATAQQTVSVLC